MYVSQCPIMAAVSPASFPHASLGNELFHKNDTDSKPAPAEPADAALAPPAAASAGDKEIQPLEDKCRTVAPTENAEDGTSVFASLPSWTHFFLNRCTYKSLPVVGVVTPERLSQLHDSAVAAIGQCSPARSFAEPVPAAPARSALNNSVTTAAADAPDTLRVTNAAGGAATTGAIARACLSVAAAPTEQKPANCPDSVSKTIPGVAASLECLDDENSYRHFLHDTLVLGGGVSELQYFVSTEESGDMAGAACEYRAAERTADTAATEARKAPTDLAQMKTEVKQPNISDAPAAAEGKSVAEGDSGVARNHMPQALVPKEPHASLTRESVKHERSNDSQEPQRIPCPLPEGHPEKETARHLILTCRVSRGVCGHKGVVHGGFIATLIDNAMGYLAFLLIPRPATKSLTVNYLKPLLAGTFVLVEVRKVERSSTDSSSTRSSLSVHSGGCSSEHPTSQRNADATGRSLGDGANTGDYRGRRTMYCTLEARVYTYVPDRLRANFPPKPEGEPAPSLQGDRAQSDVQHATTSKASSRDGKNGQEDPGKNSSFIEGMRSSTGVGCNGFANRYAAHCAKAERGNASCERQGTNHRTESTHSNSTNGGAAPSKEKRQQPPQSKRSSESLPPNVWLVTTAEAVFVDVSAKWKSLA